MDLIYCRFGSAVTSFEKVIRVRPVVFALEQNYPNPFNPITEIAFGVGRDGPVVLSIHDVSGKLIRRLINRNLPAGAYTESWDGRDAKGRKVASGIYFYRLKAGKKSLYRKAVLLR